MLCIVCVCKLSLLTCNQFKQDLESGIVFLSILSGNIEHADLISSKHEKDDLLPRDGFCVIVIRLEAV